MLGNVLLSWASLACVSATVSESSALIASKSRQLTLQEFLTSSSGEFEENCVALDQFNWPRFESTEEMEASKWSAYYRTVYGEIPDTYPVCVYDFWFIHMDAFHAAGIQQEEMGSVYNQTLVKGDWHPENDWGNWEWLRDNHDTDTLIQRGYVKKGPEKPGFLWHHVNGFKTGWWISHGVHGWEAQFSDNSWVEVRHSAGGDTKEHGEMWFLYARGNGVWFNVGKTEVLKDKDEAEQELCKHWIKPHGFELTDGTSPFQPCAVAKGLDSLQLHNYLREIIAFPSEHRTDLEGFFTCGREGGGVLGDYIRGGWRASKSCKCDPDVKQINCLD